jgi:hypothetical protein
VPGLEDVCDLVIGEAELGVEQHTALAYDGEMGLFCGNVSGDVSGVSGGLFSGGGGYCHCHLPIPLWAIFTSARQSVTDPHCYRSSTYNGPSHQDRYEPRTALRLLSAPTSQARA